METCRTRKHDKVIIFDWDDTLCPSSFVDQWKFESYTDLPQHYKNLFVEIGCCVEKCLDAASEFGQVIIITNSDDGWVKYSAERFVPNLLPCLQRYPIVSARTRYERFYPNQPLCWKAAAFAHEVNELYSSTKEKNYITSEDDISNSSVGSLVSTDDSSIDSSMSSGELQNGDVKLIMKDTKGQPTREIVSFGDSMEERTAVRIVANQLSALPKSVMFINTPSPMQIIGQLVMLTNNMSFLCEKKSSLDLEISPEQAHKAAESYLYGSTPKEEQN